MTALSSFPPGVSGAEPQIAGWPERSWQLECPGCALDTEVVCVWEGDRLGNGTLSWTCPGCGQEQSVGREAGDDHPDL